MSRRTVLRTAAGLAAAAAFTLATPGQAGVRPEFTTTAGTTCPARPPSVPAARGPHDPFVPSHATSLLICRYAGLNQHVASGTLVRSLRTRPATVARLLDRAQKPAPHASYSCPAEFGDEALLSFGYAGNRTYQVVQQLSGCEFATAAAGSRLAGLAAEAVTRLVGADTY